MNNKQWKIARRAGIGGSDAAAILGFSPWKSPMDVYLEKTGLADEQPEDKNRQFLLELGTQLEPVIAKLYERETGKHLQLPFPVRWQHPQHNILFGTPDRVIEGANIGVELKSENQFQNEFGEPGTDQVPYHYLIQCAQYMAITGYPQWDVALLHGGAKFSVYTLHRDKELEDFMIEELRAWWDHHIVANVPPDIDGSDAWKVYLRKKFPANLLPIGDADEETLTHINELALARYAISYWETLEAELQNRIKLKIAEHEGLQGDFGRITWKKTKDRSSTDFVAAFELLSDKLAVPHEVRDEILKQFTSSAPGSRRFLFSPRKGWSPHGQAASGTETGKLSGAAAALQSGDRPRSAKAFER